MRYAVIVEQDEKSCENGEPIPPTNSHVEYVEVLAA
jgi:hypothetical protein